MALGSCAAPPTPLLKLGRRGSVRFGQGVPSQKKKKKKTKAKTNKRWKNERAGV